MKIRYGIIGANGYVGQELFALAQSDDRLECVLQSTSHDAIDETMLENKPQIVFFATPHGVCMQYAPFFLSKGIKVIDLSGDFRFKNIQDFEKSYTMQHTNPHYQAVFGLSEHIKNELPHSAFVANPGCYVTASLLPLLPIAEYCERIIIDGKSGYSGAGKAFSKKEELEQNSCMPYMLTKHRHEAEIQQFFHCPLVFTPHLINTFRGMLVTLHVFLKTEFQNLDIFEIVKNQYKNDELVSVQKEIPTISSVQNTNHCIIGGFEQDEHGRIVIISVIDNLRKGAASQALQNMYGMMNISLPKSFF